MLPSQLQRLISLRLELLVRLSDHIFSEAVQLEPGLYWDLSCVADLHLREGSWYFLSGNREESNYTCTLSDSNQHNCLSCKKSALTGKEKNTPVGTPYSPLLGTAMEMWVPCRVPLFQAVRWSAIALPVDIVVIPRLLIISLNRVLTVWNGNFHVDVCMCGHSSDPKKL